MKRVQECVRWAKRRGFLIYLYDEDRWPSGYGGGLVTRRKRFRARRLIFTPFPRSRGAETSGRLMQRYAIAVGRNGLQSYRKLRRSERPKRGETEWFAYLELAEPSERYNGATNLDGFNPEAVAEFVRVTHEAYRAAVGKEFGKTVPSIFTDEPHPTPFYLFPRPEMMREVVLPFTDDFPQTYHDTFGEDFWATFPEIIWDLMEANRSQARYRYHRHRMERFSSAFAGTIARWCRDKGLGLTGHVLGESGLADQTASGAEAMQFLNWMDVPGLDMLCDDIELNTAKQAQSVARQGGCSGVMSELGGVTGWTFPFAAHKAHGDWQAALGVTLRVPHLAWLSMRGEAKRDYPAPVGPQSPWFPEFRILEDHFARINVLMTRGQPVVRVGVVHPLESCWLHYAVGGRATRQRAQLDDRFENLTRWLLFHCIDFDFVSESLLPGQFHDERDGLFHVGKMAYQALILPGLETIRSSTLDCLEAFAERGGHLIFAGSPPGLVDGQPSDRARVLAAAAQSVEFASVEILEALERYREVRIEPGYAPDWSRKPTFLHQVRAEKDRRYVFICNLDRENFRPETFVSFRGSWQVRKWDTQTGESEDVRAEQGEGWTRLEWEAPPHGHLLLELHPAKRSRGISLLRTALRETARLPAPISVELSEPNVLLLDQGDWRFGEGGWQGIEESQKIRQKLRAFLRLPPRSSMPIQPWADRSTARVLGRLERRFRLETTVPLQRAFFCLEDAGTSSVTLDGECVSRGTDGWYVDEAIQRVPLPPVEAGVHEIVVSSDFSARTMVEHCYLVGDFGVEVLGRTARMIPSVRSLHWGDWTRQGLPFYGGNVTYRCEKPHVRGRLVLQIPHFRGITLRVRSNGADVGAIAFAPFQLDLPARDAGPLDITLFGHRENTFGLVHHPRERVKWYGPEAFVTQGEDWTDEYRLTPMGILTAPRILQQTPSRQR